MEGSDENVRKLNGPASVGVPKTHGDVIEGYFS
jgi:hypothetical protein